MPLAAGRANLVIYMSVNTFLCLTLKTLIYSFGFASFVMTKSDRTQICSQNLIQLTVCLMQPLSVTWLHKLEAQRSKSHRILLYPFLAKVVYDRVLADMSYYVWCGNKYNGNYTEFVWNSKVVWNWYCKLNSSFTVKI